MPKVVAVVPAFRPPADLPARLTGLAARFAVHLVDDGSPCPADPVLRACAAVPGVTVHRTWRNRGVAAALNVGVAAAAGADAVLTVDQDTDLDQGAVAALLGTWRAAQAAGVPVGAVGAGQVELPSGRVRYDARPGPAGMLSTPEVLQSGTLWGLAALRAAGPAWNGRGPFDESLGIDGVDTEACLRLRAAGFAVLLAPDAVLRHRLGRARVVRLLGREVLATGHDPRRRATITRNRLRLAGRQVRDDPRHGLVALRRLVVGSLLAVTVEDERAAKAAAIARGVVQARA